MSTRSRQRHSFTLSCRFLLKAGTILFTLLSTSFGQVVDDPTSGSTLYEPRWESLAQHGTAPKWYEDAVFGIYFHWGIYSVPAFGGEKYPMHMYKKGSSVHKHHCETYGDPVTFGYHDFLPMFKAEKWDPDRWAKLFKEAHADFAGSIGEHHDGFAMWDSEYDSYDAMDRGPRRDVVGEMAQALRVQGLRVVTTFHNLRWDYFDAGRRLCPEGVGVNDPRLSDLYGPVHRPSTSKMGTWHLKVGSRENRPEDGEPVTETFQDFGYNKLIEVIDIQRSMRRSRLLRSKKVSIHLWMAWWT